MLFVGILCGTHIRRDLYHITLWCSLITNEYRKIQRYEFPVIRTNNLLQPPIN